MPNSPNPGPGYKARPEHRVDLVPGPARVRVVLGNEIIAETTSAITLREASYPPVHYIPAADVRHDLLAASPHKTYCPFKGEASYWSIKLDGARVENAVWAYCEPYDEVAPIKGYMAFYPKLVDDIIIG